MPADPRTHRLHLRAAGVSLVLDTTGGRIPAVLHWGSDLGPLDASGLSALFAVTTPAISSNGPDVPLRTGLLPQNADGWLGRPGLTGARDDGSGTAPRLRVLGVRITEGGAGRDLVPGADDAVETGPALVCFDLADEELRLGALLEVELLPSGLVRVRAEVTNTGSDAYTVQHLTPVLPVPLDADQILDFGGRWTKERAPQRRAMVTGTHLRENRRGRTGADAAHLLHLGTSGFDFSSGEIWAVHTAFSGNHLHFAERLSAGVQVIGGGELLLPGEGRLDPGASLASPWLYGAHSAAGLDAIAHRFHAHLRAREEHGGLPYPDTRRPVTLNVWEAVYFDHDLAVLSELADRAADLGVERFVLDDGWFGSRRDDSTGLGDWTVSQEVWPNGLGPLIDHVTGLGMQFGLWFEPEMISPDSDLARAHPDWIMAPSPERMPLPARHQQVLNLSIPAAWQHVHDAIDALLTEYDIAYIKWDHNRDLVEAATQATGAAAVHAQTLALYRLWDSLKAAHPGLEIESCSSGGARVDLGILERADRIWVSDCIDPLERATMNRWTAQLVPLELMGSHIASGASHTTGRLHSLSFRAASALLGHLGIEWDLRQASAEELEELRTWIARHKEHRDLLFTGDLVRADRGQDSIWITGVLSPARDRGLFTVTAVDTPDIAPVGALRLPGLDPERPYRVHLHRIGPAPTGYTWPAWARQGVDPAADGRGRGYGPPELIDHVDVPGSVLVRTGLAAPVMAPETAFLLEVEALPSGSPRP
ncbi:alpha-galactosidase [Brachybacterium sp. J144]|uniref:alpha-galactosidase n=1 Tax=Brachybacterium sp. J144 TaxID=3116487 RepID=UPI002E76D971|nr:alpha-galactosidase [Brachybacterium sp. J144]MEE1651558.1 alpha-galactosidase [Brachybacterium sp. J144]